MSLPRETCKTVLWKVGLIKPRGEMNGEQESAEGVVGFVQSDHSIVALTRKGRNSGVCRSGNDRTEGWNDRRASKER